MLLASSLRRALRTASSSSPLIIRSLATDAAPPRVPNPQFAQAGPIGVERSNRVPRPRQRTPTDAPAKPAKPAKPAAAAAAAAAVAAPPAAAPRPPGPARAVAAAAPAESCGTLIVPDDAADGVNIVDKKTGEWGGPTRGGSHPEPTRYGDWEQKGRCYDF